ncbi:hypothetical protein OQA88_13075 [Cercophora sp. LCS_1]
MPPANRPPLGLPAVGSIPVEQRAGQPQPATLQLTTVADTDKRRRKQPPAASPTRKFACPYYKRSPERAHVYARHVSPPQCPRCWEPFEDGELLKHLQQDLPCAVQAERKVLDGYTKEQEKMLRSRKKARCGMSEEEKWIEMYRILFPDDRVSLVPNPYYESVMNSTGEFSGGLKEHISNFLAEEVPGHVHREVATAFQNEFRDVPQSLRPRIEQFVVSLGKRVFNKFEEFVTAKEVSQLELHGVSEGRSKPQHSHMSAVMEPVDFVDFSLPNVDGSAIEQDWGFNESTLDLGFEKLLDSGLFQIEPEIAAQAEVIEDEVQ